MILSREWKRSRSTPRAFHLMSNTPAAAAAAAMPVDAAATTVASVSAAGVAPQDALAIVSCRQGTIHEQGHSQ